jgi:EAL domain-containing protein (putative c-di-GMP-specific phosphodiesterase class I)/GGDEF domain-containing protein
MAGPYLIVDNDNDRDRDHGSDGSYLAVCVMSLEGLGRITSLFGSEVAGAAAKEYASRLQTLVRDDDELITINEGKHCLLIPGLRDRNHATLAGLKLERLFAIPYEQDDASIVLQVRAGIACAPSSNTEAEALFRSAETAREMARSSGRTYQVADELDVQALRRRWQLNDQVDQAIREHALRLYYQPKVMASDHSVAGAEGLIRWEHPDGLLSPAEFLPYLDSHKMMLLTKHVIRQCVRDLAADARLPNLAINLDSVMLTNSGLLRLMLDEISLWEVDPKRLTIEVTESGLVESLSSLCPEFEQLRALGVRVAMDDFGTGNSSLAQFRNLPLDELKVDRSFITHLQTDSTSRYLTRMMIDLGHHFGLSVVAEGVENRAIAKQLREFGCDLLQGFHFAPPLPLAHFARWSASHSSSE